MTKVWPGSAPAGQLAVALVLCALSSAAVAQPAPSTVDSEAIRAVDRYLETWNSRNPMIWAGSLHFPHVRPGAGNFRLTRTPEEYARGVDFKRVLATGWHRSMWDSYDVVQHGPAKAHVAGRYSRYTEDGERIRTTFVTYVVTRQGDRWGVQSRFAAGPADVDPNQAAASELAALGAVETFFAALGNPTDPERCAVSRGSRAGAAADLGRHPSRLGRGGAGWRRRGQRGRSLQSVESKWSHVVQLRGPLSRDHAGWPHWSASALQLRAVSGKWV